MQTKLSLPSYLRAAPYVARFHENAMLSGLYTQLFNFSVQKTVYCSSLAEYASGKKRTDASEMQIAASVVYF